MTSNLRAHCCFDVTHPCDWYRNALQRCLTGLGIVIASTALHAVMPCHELFPTHLECRVTHPSSELLHMVGRDRTKNGARTGRPDVTASDQATYHLSSLNGDKAVVIRGAGGKRWSRHDGGHKGAKGHTLRPSLSWECPLITQVGRPRSDSCLTPCDIIPRRSRTSRR
jgi:hypothetical protein